MKLSAARARRVFFLLAFMVIALPVPAAAPVTNIPAAGPGHSGIASAYPLASDAGKEILAKGGNAFDAAVAVAAALSVVEPCCSGLGGGGFFLLRRASDGLETMIDLREMAPGAATRDMFLDKDGNAVASLSRDSALAAGIPGEPAGLVYMAKKFGKLPLSVSMAPAIKLAREGFPLYERLRGAVNFKKDAFLKTGDATRVYLVNGEVPAIGYIIKQPDLAESLELLATKGADGFYKGAFAKKLVAGVQQLGGNWTEADLANYKAIERAPVVGHYRGARIVSGSPPTSGGIALIDALNILEGFDLDKVDRVTRTHLIVEAMRRVHRDRAVYLGDPDFVDVPVARLINEYYAAGQRASIRMDRATPSAALPGVDAAPAGTQTTHFSVIDKHGNMVAATITLNFYFGSGLMIPGTGILLNNQMDDFSAKAGVPNGFQLIGGDANSIAPRKRPLSSSTPTFVEAPTGLMIIGSPGGSRIPGMVILGTLNFLDGKHAQEIVAAPRFHHQFSPDVIEFEPGALSAEERAQLEKLGHTLKEGSRKWGNTQAVTWDYKTGKVEAASDPRGVGEGMVY
ncbi:MAG TPA: gamma-glutamyltransferase [Steroidobacteraceae bacterium]|jgi:gamma-glutamyltranspeptidase/glutathione hydrolase|nr:gamma-glutamyltransferase [Steroidobacteraceae bacterium]